MRTLAQVRRKMKIASVAPVTRDLYVIRPARVVRTRRENLRLARRDTAPKPSALRVGSRRVGFRRRGSDAAGDATPPEATAAGAWIGWGGVWVALACRTVCLCLCALGGSGLLTGVALVPVTLLRPCESV